MTTWDAITFWAAVSAVPAAHVYPLVLMWTTPWTRKTTGWALMFSSLGIMLLMDLWLLGIVYEDDYPLRDLLRAAIAAFISLGVNLKLVSILRDKFQRRPDDAPIP